MGSSAAAREPFLSLDAFTRLPPWEGKEELVRGRLVREPPVGYPHGQVQGGLFEALRRFVRERGLGEVVAGVGFILEDDPPTVRAPDLAFVRAERVPEARASRPFPRFAPDLAVEVLSPSNSASRMQAKALGYLAAGSRLVWVVDGEAGTVQVWRSPDDIRRLTRDGVLDGHDVLPGLAMKVGDVLEP